MYSTPDNSPQPALAIVSPGVFVVLAILAYLAVMFVLPDLLPERMSYDSRNITKLMEMETDASDSFGVTARLFAMIPEPLLLPSIALMGCLCIAWLGNAASRVSTQVMASMMLVPLLTMGLMRPQKEVVVVAMAMALTFIVSRWRSSALAILAIVSAYVAYGVLVRPYYLLIAPLFVVLAFKPRLTFGVVVLASLAGLLVLLLLPPEIYAALQGPRDMINEARRFAGDANRSMFFNPWEPTSALAFIGNYLYALLRFHLPVAFDVTPQDVFLTGTSLLYLSLLRTGYRLGSERARLLSLLFGAHLLVLTLFESDAGTYLRHLSSVSLYLWPALLLKDGSADATRHRFLGFAYRPVAADKAKPR